MFRPPRIFYLMNKAHAAMARASDRRTREVAGLSMVQHGVLFALGRQDGQTASDLARLLSVRKSSLSGLIDRMEERALVRRVKDEGDGRVVRLYLSEGGQSILTRTNPQVIAMNAALLAPFTEEEQQVIGRFLKHMADNAEAVIDGAPASRGGED